MSVSESYVEGWVVVPTQLNRLSSLMESILHHECGRSWALSDIPNLTGMERNSEYNIICLQI